MEMRQIMRGFQISGFATTDTMDIGVSALNRGPRAEARDPPHAGTYAEAVNR